MKYCTFVIKIIFQPGKSIPVKKIFSKHLSVRMTNVYPRNIFVCFLKHGYSCCKIQLVAILYTVCSNSDVILKTAPISGWIKYFTNIGGNASGSTGGNTDVNTGANMYGNHIFNTGSNTLLVKVKTHKTAPSSLWFEY